jgi:hypothetical protein
MENDRIDKQFTANFKENKTEFDQGTFLAASLLPFKRLLRVVEPSEVMREGFAAVTKPDAVELDKDDEILPNAAVCNVGADARLSETLPPQLLPTSESPLESHSLHQR